MYLNFDKDSKRQCPICLEAFEEEKLVLINDCQHFFCQECMNSYLQTVIINRSKYPIICPFFEKCQNCNTIISPHIILNVVKDKNSRERYLQHALSKYFESSPEEMIWCPSRRCYYGMQKSALNPNCDCFDCPICKREYCLKCKEEYHEGKLCGGNVSNEKNEEEKFLDGVKSLNMKRCPKCKAWVEKNKGCNHIICVCGSNFCYVCGETLEPSSLGHNCSIPIGSNVSVNNIFSQMIDDFYVGLTHQNPVKYQYKKRPSIKSEKTHKNSDYDKKAEIHEIHVPLKSDGTPDMRFAISKAVVPIKSDGTPDMRYAINKPSSKEYVYPVGPTKNDGTLDMRFKENKELVENYSSKNVNLPTKKDGTLDMRFKINQEVAKRGSKKK